MLSFGALISVLEYILRSENSQPKLVCDLSLPLPLSLSLSPSLLKNPFHVSLILEAARLVHRCSEPAHQQGNSVTSRCCSAAPRVFTLNNEVRREA